MSNTEKQIAELKQKLEELQRQTEEYLNGWKRTKADYLNREREIEKEKVQWIKFANLELILNLLPILDSFEQSIKQLATTETQKPANTEAQKSLETQKISAFQGPQSSEIQGLQDSESQKNSEIQRLQEWTKGVLKIKEQFESFLKNQGVEKIKTLGEKFNPEFHEAAEKCGESNEIIEEIQAGYTMHGQVIRPAKVIIK